MDRTGRKSTGLVATITRGIDPGRTRTVAAPITISILQG